MSSADLRIAFFGTPDFAVPTLERLLAGPHPVVAVVSQPDRGRGRGRKLAPSPVSQLATEQGLPLLRPERVGEDESVDWLRAQAPDLGVVVAFGQFIPKRVRELPSRGYLINAHASLLPRFRGAAPIAHAILAGESHTGVSVMRVEKEMDAGAVALQRKTPIATTEDTGALSKRLAEISAEAIAEVLERIAAGSADWSAQDHEASSFAPKIGRDDARLDFAEPAEALVRRVRAMSPSPGAHTTWQGELLRVLEARAEVPAEGRKLVPGRVTREDDGLRVATGRGWLVPTRLQRAGGRALDVAEFLRGRSISDGELLGVDASE